MGLKERGSEWGAGQWASFFCLENKHWRVIGLDTGYNSTRFDWGKVPLLRRSKWLRKTTSFKPGCNLPEPLLAWLKSSVNPDGDKRGLILLSHHGPHSAFEDWYQRPAQQLAKLIHRPVIWFWGHEHRLAIYEKFSVMKGIEAHGRGLATAACPSSGSPDIPIADGSLGITGVIRATRKMLATTDTATFLSRLCAAHRILRFEAIAGPHRRLAYRDRSARSWTWPEESTHDPSLHCRQAKKSSKLS
jgi:hypothetical protein